MIENDLLALSAQRDAQTVFTPGIDAHRKVLPAIDEHLDQAVVDENTQAQWLIRGTLHVSSLRWTGPHVGKGARLRVVERHDAGCWIPERELPVVVVKGDRGLFFGIL